jgi:hypothetical protein
MPRCLLALAVLLLSAGCAGREVGKARAALSAGQPDVAVGILGAVLADDPANAEALVAMGDAQLLLGLRAKGLSDAAGHKAALARAAEAYAGAQKAEPGDCLARSRGVMLRLSTRGATELTEDEAVGNWDACPSPEILWALLGNRPRWATDDRVAALRKGLGVSLGEWSAGPGFGGPPAVGDNALVLISTPARAVGQSEPYGPADMSRYAEIVVMSVSAYGVAFEDKGHPVGVPTTAWVFAGSIGRNGYLDHRPGPCWDGGGCRAGPARGPVYATGGYEPGDGPIAPFEGGIRCTGSEKRDFYKSHCQVAYETRGYAIRELPANAVAREPAVAKGRGARLRLIAGSAPEDVVGHLANGELAPGLPASDAAAVVAQCAPDPLGTGQATAAGLGFDGTAMTLTCALKLGTLTFRGGLLADVRWARP